MVATQIAGSVLRVFVVDDHPIVRGGLRALIEAESDMLVVGEAADGAAALEGVATARPDVVVMDLTMPVMSGADATVRLRASFPEVKVLALTAFEERSQTQRLLDAGAAGLVFKRTAAEELVRAIRALAAGGGYIDPVLAAQTADVHGASPLSERETEVLRLVAAGHQMKDIAARLDISTRTLETYRTRALDKLGLRTRADIVRYAAQHGWLD